MNTRSRSAVLAAIVMLAVSCGSNGDNHLSAAARHHLETLTKQIRSAAESGDRVRSSLSLGALRSAVAGYERSGDIGASRAQRVLADANSVQIHLALLPAPVTTTTTTAPPPPAAPPAKGPGKGHKEQHKHGGQGDQGD